MWLPGTLGAWRSVRCLGAAGSSSWQEVAGAGWRTSGTWASRASRSGVVGPSGPASSYLKHAEKIMWFYNLQIMVVHLTIVPNFMVSISLSGKNPEKFSIAVGNNT